MHRDSRSNVHHWTYAHLLSQVNLFSAFLQSLQIKRSDVIFAITADTNPWRIVLDQASVGSGITVAGSYPQDNVDTIVFKLKMTESKYLFTDAINFEKAKQVALKADNIPVILIDGLCDIKNEQNFQNFTSNKTVGNFIYPNISQNEIAYIIFSSGTTGRPMGAGKTHGNLAYYLEIAKDMFPFKPGDPYLNYAPISHIAVASVQLIIFQAGAHMMLSNAANLMGDLKHLKPAVFFGVPLIWSQIYDKLNRNRLGIFFPKLFGSIVKWKLGLNHCKLMISSGAKLDVSILNFFQRLGIIIDIIYGSTETTVATMTNRGSPIGSDGFPISDNIKLRIIGDNGKLSNTGQSGTIYVKSPMCSDLFFHSIDRQKPEITADGFMQTNDVGVVGSKGELSIIGRLNHCVKLSNGTFVNTSEIAMKIKESFPIFEHVVVHAENQADVAAIVNIGNNPESLERAAKALGLQFDKQTNSINVPVEELQEKVEEYIRKHVDFSSKDATAPKHFIFVNEPFTSENGTMTALGKIREPIIIKCLKDELVRFRKERVDFASASMPSAGTE